MKSLDNEERAELLLKRYGFRFDTIIREEIRNLLINEIEHYVSGSSEYIRVLCGYLFCIGNIEDLELLKKAKYNINFDVGCMIDLEWIENIDVSNKKYKVRRTKLIADFVDYYKTYFNLRYNLQNL